MNTRDTQPMPLGETAAIAGAVGILLETGIAVTEARVRALARMLFWRARRIARGRMS